MIDRLRNILSDKGKRTAFELIAGTVVYDLLAVVVGSAIGLFFSFNRLVYVAGVLLGMAVAVFMVIHMYAVLEKAILCDKKQAKRKTKLGAFLRMLVMAGSLVAAALLPEYISIVGVIIGIFVLKIAALSQPLIDRFISKFVKKEE